MCLGGALGPVLAAGATHLGNHPVNLKHPTAWEFCTANRKGSSDNLLCLVV